MVINVPLQIDDAALEGKLKEEYQKKVVEKVSEIVMESLAEMDRGWSRVDTETKVQNVIVRLVERNIDSYFEDHKDEIFEAITKKLWDRARNRKVLKEAANSAAEGGLNEA